MAKAIMIQGTMSNAGKSLLAAGLCRIFKKDGYRVAPFKSQNMALNSFITEEGLEMGRAQVVQAEAAGIKPVADMNPILLKPSSDTGSQVIVRGRPIGNMKAREYFAYKRNLIPEIRRAYENLSGQYDIIVIEGAGSPAEINLKQDDIVNMGMARMAGAPVLLAGDIDRGGVFAQLYGTMMLLEESERSFVKGMIINKFRGDKTILDPGVRMIEELCGVPVVGVTPYMKVDIEDEDSLSGRLTSRGGAGKSLVEIGIIRFPRMSNFTDFSVFSCIPGVEVRYISSLTETGCPDMIILPGTKNTMEDLVWMRQSGLESYVKKMASGGLPVWGICGGFQMLGRTLSDEGKMENQTYQKLDGMELLPMVTEFEQEKTRTRVRGQFGSLNGIFKGLSHMKFEGYEIHMGRSMASGNAAGGADTEDRDAAALGQINEYQEGAAGSKEDGMAKGNIFGTYVHGIFDREGVALEIVKALMEKKGLSSGSLQEPDYAGYKEMQFDILERELRHHLDMKRIYEILEQGVNSSTLERV